MKRAKVLTFCAAAIALGAACAVEWATRSEPAPAEPPARSAEVVAQKAESPDARRRAPLPEPPRSDCPGCGAPPAPSFDSLVQTYSVLSDEEILATIEGLDREIESRELIRRANEDTLDERGREELRLLLRRQNALQAAKAQRLLDKADSEDAEASRGR